MTNLLNQHVVLALFFSLSLLLSRFQDLNAADDAPVTFISLQLSVAEDGNRTLTVHNREISAFHKVTPQ